MIWASSYDSREDEDCDRERGHDEWNDYDTMRGDDVFVDDNQVSSSFPTEEIEQLVRKWGTLDSGSPPTIRKIPTGCGILQNLQLLGVFPTTRWLQDPTINLDVKELFGGGPVFPLGEYRVANLDVIDALGNVIQLTLIVNTGVEGMKTGYWGGAFERVHQFKSPSSTTARTTTTPRCFARFKKSSENQETTINEQRISQRDTKIFHEFEDLYFATTHDYCCVENDDDDDDDDDDGSVTNSTNKENCHRHRHIPVLCHTQFEYLLSIAVEFILDLDWNLYLPDTLLERRDRSPNIERKKRANRRTSMVPKTLFDSSSSII